MPSIKDFESLLYSKLQPIQAKLDDLFKQMNDNNMALQERNNTLLEERNASWKCYTGPQIAILWSLFEQFPAENV